MKAIGSALAVRGGRASFRPALVQLVGTALDAASPRSAIALQAGRSWRPTWPAAGPPRRQARGLDDDVAHLAHPRLEVVCSNKVDGLGGLVHLVDGVVHRLDQVLDVAAVERRDEAATDGQQHLAGDVVGAVLELDDGAAVTGRCRGRRRAAAAGRRPPRPGSWNAPRTGRRSVPPEEAALGTMPSSGNSSNQREIGNAAHLSPTAADQAAGKGEWVGWRG